ncbi:unnamed protein product [marine sediment metagenome]|uniref:Uncharacterized protein n=1 Tax=marine sediment metagenome TaxID=412755 RepID=X0YYS5_9ZZZZ
MDIFSKIDLRNQSDDLLDLHPDDLLDQTCDIEITHWNVDPYTLASSAVSEMKIKGHIVEVVQSKVKGEFHSLKIYVNDQKNRILCSITIPGD